MGFGGEGGGWGGLRGGLGSIPQNPSNTPPGWRDPKPQTLNPKPSTRLPKRLPAFKTALCSQARKLSALPLEAERGCGLALGLRVEGVGFRFRAEGLGLSSLLNVGPQCRI